MRMFVRIFVLCVSLFDEVEEDATQEEIDNILYEVTAGEDVCLYLCSLCLFDEVEEDATQEEIDKILYEVTAGEDVCLFVPLFFVLVCLMRWRTPFRRRLTRFCMRSQQVRMFACIFVL